MDVKYRPFIATRWALLKNNNIKIMKLVRKRAVILNKINFFQCASLINVLLTLNLKRTIKA